MTTHPGIPKGAAIAINDMLENCARIQKGQEVLILAHMDGLYGGDNLVDKEAIAWIQAAVQMHGANASVLWFDEPAKAYAWRFPPVVRGAISGCDFFINHSFDIVTEENVSYRQYIKEQKKVVVRNMATTASLLCTAWAQTPYELVSEIRYQASLNFRAGLSWTMTDDNGTDLEGTIIPSDNPAFPAYSMRREEFGYYRPWPEWVNPPVTMAKINGTYVFDTMLSWWSRYIGISPYFNKPIRLTVKNCQVTKIEGGDEADALSRFLAMMRGRLGDGVYDFNTLHFGVHPQAFVAPHQCPSILYRRLIEHSHSSNIHVHIGPPPEPPTYPYWMHCTGDVRKATFRVGNTLIHDRGHLTALDHPAVKAVAAKYRGRPGLEPEPVSY